MSYNHHSSGPGQTYTEGDILASKQYGVKRRIHIPQYYPLQERQRKMKAGDGTTTFYFDKFDKFKNKNADKIINFEASRGTKLPSTNLRFLD